MPTSFSHARCCPTLYKRWGENDVHAGKPLTNKTLRSVLKKMMVQTASFRNSRAFSGGGGKLRWRREKAERDSMLGDELKVCEFSRVQHRLLSEIPGAKSQQRELQCVLRCVHREKSTAVV